MNFNSKAFKQKVVALEEIFPSRIIFQIRGGLNLQSVEIMVKNNFGSLTINHFFNHNFFYLCFLFNMTQL